MKTVFVTSHTLLGKTRPHIPNILIYDVTFLFSFVLLHVNISEIVLSKLMWWIQMCIFIFKDKLIWSSFILEDGWSYANIMYVHILHFHIWNILSYKVKQTYLTEAVGFRFFYLLILIESMMPCIWTRYRGPPAEKQAHNIKDPAVYLTLGMSLFVLNSSGGLLPKSSFLVSSDHRSQCHLKFQSCLTTEYAGVCFWMSEDHFFWNPPEQHVLM